MIKRFHMCWLFAMLLIVLGGCAQTPVPSTYHLSYQKKMQAAHHWDVLATDVAAQVTRMLDDCLAKVTPCDPNSAGGKKIFVKMKNNTPFSKAFEELVKSRLVENGLIVLRHRNQSSLVLECDVQTIYHRANRLKRPMPGIFTAIAMGVLVFREGPAIPAAYGSAMLADLSIGAFTFGLPHTEVIITSSLLEEDTYLVRRSDIYYVNDADHWHYDDTPPLALKEIAVQ